MRRSLSRFQVLQGTQVVATPAVPPLGAGPQTLTWDGLLADGSRAPDGTYTLALTITDDVTTFTRTATLTLDTTAPVITVLSYRNLRFRVSEPATLTLIVGTRRYTRVLKKPATTQFWLKTKPSRVPADRDRRRRQHGDRALPPVRRSPAVVAELELAQDRREERRALDLAAELDAKRRRRLRGVGRAARPRSD